MGWAADARHAVTIALTPHHPAKNALLRTRFAFELFRQLSPDPEGNIFFSPASVMLCLLLLREGATGETRDSIANALNMADLSSDSLHSAGTALTSALQVEGPGLQLEAATSLWYRKDWEPRSEYRATARKDYNAEILSLGAGDAETVARVNSWVSEKTRGRIGSILNSLDPLASMLLISAIYFKASWKEPFEREFTEDDWFHLRGSGKVKVPFMHQRSSFLYYEERAFQAVRLPYQTSRLAMHVFLPAKTSNLDEFQQSLTPANWDKWTGGFEEVDGHIELPRFKLEYQSGLQRALTKLGMGIAFDRGRARFDTICPPPPPIWIDQVLHRAFVEINEEGTEAAAVTAIAMEWARMPTEPQRTFEMIVDRPFFFAISDNYTNTILFMGSVEQPRSA